MKPHIRQHAYRSSEDSNSDFRKTLAASQTRIVAGPAFLLRAVLIAALFSATASAQTPYRTVVLSGQHAGGTSGDVNYRTFFSPVINAAGEVAFYAALAGADVSSDDSSGLWRSDAGALDLIARTGSAAPGVESGVTLASLTGLALNDLGGVGFQGFLLSSTGTTSTASFVGGETPPQLLARTGSTAPGVGSGTAFSTVIAPL